MRLIPLMLVVLLSMFLTDSDARDKPARAPQAEAVPELIDQGPSQLLQSTSSLQQLANRETAGPDTLLIYGGPDRPLEGKFEDANGHPSFNDWTSVDLTEQPFYWNVGTYAAENLNGNGSGNHAYWCGRDVTQEPGWATPPGYGNNWLQDLIWESGPVADTGTGQVVDLDFFFNVDLEEGYDFFEVAFDSAGHWITVYDATAINPGSQPDYPNSFAEPGMQYSTLGALPIEYVANGYGGFLFNEVRIRFRMFSDGAYSDEDGFYDSRLGAVQIDDVSVTWSDGSQFENFEGPPPWKVKPLRAPFAGDFADVHILATDLDACRSNLTPAMGFIDYGQEPRNGPGSDGTVSTGGETSENVQYGITGHYVVSHSGGLTLGGERFDNAVMSPEIMWDLPGPADDGPEFVGAFFRFDVWDDLPITNPIFRSWAVRSAASGEDWGSWEGRGSGLHYGPRPIWRSSINLFGDLLAEGGLKERLQVRLGVHDLSYVFSYNARDATPAPLYDNVSVYKYRVGGPRIATTLTRLANDGFPAAGLIDASSSAARGELDIPFDMAGDVNSGAEVKVSGDSVVIDVQALIPGTTVTDIRMIWALNKNPVFEDAIRVVPSRSVDRNVVPGASVWTGEVVAGISTTPGGVVIPDHYYMDLPDHDFLYPGDVLHYYFEATDSDGRVTTLPADTGGFGVFDGVFDRTFTVRGLPSISAADNSQPSLLVINDAYQRQGEQEFLLAFRELGMEEGVEFDTYTVQGAGGDDDSGIGSSGAHGANVLQLGGYEDILYLSGSSLHTLSSGVNGSADDLSLITAWSQLAGTRQIAYFGDNIPGDLARGDLDAARFLIDQLGVLHLGENVRRVTGQFSPIVRPMVAGFSSDYVAYGGCPTPKSFDHIGSVANGTTAHGFVDRNTGTVIPNVAASVMRPRANGYDILFPFSFDDVRNVMARTALSSRALLLQEVFELTYSCPQPCTDAPAARPVILSVRPNPFNPSTVVEFTAMAGSRGSVRVFNLRGELVQTLHSGEFRTTQFRWDGTDARGAAVASGVYVVRAETEGATQTAKVALVK